MSSNNLYLSIEAEKCRSGGDRAHSLHWGDGASRVRAARPFTDSVNNKIQFYSRSPFIHYQWGPAGAGLSNVVDYWMIRAGNGTSTAAEILECCSVPLRSGHFGQSLICNYFSQRLIDFLVSTLRAPTMRSLQGHGTALHGTPGAPRTIGVLHRYRSPAVP